MTPLDVLQKTRSVLDRPANWLKNAEFDPKTGAVSLDGAVSLAVGCAYVPNLLNSTFTFDTSTADPEYAWLWLVAEQFILNAAGGLYYSLEDINDDPFTCHQDIINLLDKAINLAS